MSFSTGHANVALDSRYASKRLAAEKNRAFRESMIGKTLSAVTLHEAGTALTENYLKVELAQPRQANRIVELKIGGLSGDGLREQTSLPVL